MKKYTLVITKEEDGKTEEVCREEMNSIAIVGEDTGERIVEIILNDSVQEIGFKLAQTNRLIEAAKLAVGFNKFLSRMSEELLKHNIMEGLQ